MAHTWLLVYILPRRFHLHYRKGLALGGDTRPACSGSVLDPLREHPGVCNGILVSSPFPEELHEPGNPGCSCSWRTACSWLDRGVNLRLEGPDPSEELPTPLKSAKGVVTWRLLVLYSAGSSSAVDMSTISLRSTLLFIPRVAWYHRNRATF